MLNRDISSTGPFSIAMLVCQRVPKIAIFRLGVAGFPRPIDPLGYPPAVSLSGV